MMRPISHSLIRKQLKTVRVSATKCTTMMKNILGFLEGALTLEVNRDFNLGKFGLIRPTI